MPQEKDQQLVAKGPRVFVGLKIAPSIAQELARRAQCLERSPSRFIACEDIHLTLLPPWNEMEVDEAIARLRVAVSGVGPFPLTFTRLSYWPNDRRPRLLCAECTPTGELTALQSALLIAFGQTNDRPFQPHVTLARMQRGAKAASAKSALDQDLVLLQSVDTVELFQSPKPPAKGYEILASLPLAAPRRTWRDFLKQSLIRISGLWWQLTHPAKAEEAARKKGRSQIAIATPSRSGVSKCYDS